MENAPKNTEIYVMQGYLKHSYERPDGGQFCVVLKEFVKNNQTVLKVRTQYGVVKTIAKTRFVRRF